MDQLNQSRIILVANRLPFQTKERDGKLYVQPSSGGLVSSMVSYLEYGESTTTKHGKKTAWIGAAELPERKYNLLGKELLNDTNFESHPVFLPENIKSKFYQGFCNDCLWPLFHYFPSYAKFLPDHFDAYVKANEYFLKKVVEVYKPGDVLWIHDYHLMLLPGMLRKVLPGASIGFFLHIPFPSFEVFRIMPNPWKSQILGGLLGTDLVGFHTSDYMQYFLKSVQHVLGYDITGRQIYTPERVVTADTFPVSIDFNKFYHATDIPAVFEENNNIRKKMSGKQIVISVDRLDYSKAILNRLESFELFLEKNRRYQGKVTYILLVVPSREIITKYKENKQDIERLISSINGKYGTLDWIPVLYHYKSVDFHKLTALYFAADVALITPLRDGMNLVAKEFVSTRIDKRGVLILSDTAGAAAELKEAVIVNPSDRQEIAAALLQALTMPVEEQTTRNENMQARIRNYDVVRWADDFITQLALQKSIQAQMRIKEITPTIGKQVISSYYDATSRLLLLDYDGTLVPFAPTPQKASPSKKIMNLLACLCADQRNTVVIVSGRNRRTLESWLDKLPLGLVAEHGGYRREPGSAWKQNNEVILDWKEKIRPLLEFYQTRCAGSLIEEKELSFAWHYRNTESELGVIRARELLNELENIPGQFGFAIVEGNKVIEVRCKNVHKGAGIKHWLDSSHHDFVLCIGDDRTDEDMFSVLPTSAFSFRIGLKQSQARFNFRSQTDAVDFLTNLSQTFPNCDKVTGIAHQNIQC